MQLGASSWSRLRDARWRMVWGAGKGAEYGVLLRGTDTIEASMRVWAGPFIGLHLRAPLTLSSVVDEE